MELELCLDGEMKKYKAGFVSGRAYRKLLEYDNTMDFNKLNEEEYDELIGFTCNVFGDQFTVDQFWDGVPAHKLNEVLTNVFVFVRTGEVFKRDIKKESDEKGE